MYTILKKTKLNDDVGRMVIEAPLVAKNARPGHFLILRVDPDGERIPMTIVSHDGKTVTIIYQVVGYSTQRLDRKQEGDSLEDVVGPLGNPAPIRDVSKVIGIAGGVGAAPLYPQMKAYHDHGATVDVIIGARDRDHLLLIDAFRSFCRHVHIATDDGSAGTKGLVTDVAEDLYRRETYAHAVAIGPLIMMKHAVAVNQSSGIKTDVSLNPIMVDGTGMCGNCRVSIDGETKFACIDGPDFPAEGIDFDELIARGSHYKTEEDRIRRLQGDGDDHA